MKDRLFLLVSAAVSAMCCVACGTKDTSDPQENIDPVAMPCFTADIRAAASRANADGTAFA